MKEAFCEVTAVQNEDAVLSFIDLQMMHIPQEQKHRVVYVK